MTLQEAIQLTNENIDLIDKKISYENSTFKINRLLIDQFEKDNYKIVVCLEKQRGIEFTVDFDDFKDYKYI